MKITYSVPLGVMALLLLAGSSLLAEEIVVTDCDGRVFAKESVAGGEDRVVRVLLSRSDAAEIEATLKNRADSSVMRRAGRGERFSFDNVGAGNWHLCFSPDTSELESVEIASSRSGTGELVASLAGVTGAGVAIAAVGSSGSSGSQGLGMDPIGGGATSTSTSDGAKSEGGESAGMGASGPSARDSEAGKPLLERHPCDVAGARRGQRDRCQVDAEPDPLSPFL